MKPLLYKPGDLVTIRSDLTADRDYPVWYGPSAGKRDLSVTTIWSTIAERPMKSRITPMMMIFIDYRESLIGGLSLCLKTRPNVFVTVYCNQKGE